MKTCPTCEVTKDHSAFSKSRDRYDGLQGECKQCKKERGQAYGQLPGVKSKSCGYARKRRASPTGRSKILCDTARKNAKRDAVPFDLTWTWLEPKLHEPCELSGLPFDLSPSATDNNPRAPSLDRVNRNKGYVIGNVRVVCWQVNLARNEYGDSTLFEMVEALHRMRAISSRASKEEGSTIRTEVRRGKSPEAPEAPSGL